MFRRHGVETYEADLGADHMRYWKGGHGDETVVLLHGFGADALWQWHPQIRELSRDYQVLAPDLLWFGKSHSEREEYSIQHQARAVLALAEHENIERFHLIGVSYGGMVTHEIIGQAPKRVDRVILVASPARAFLADDKREVLAELQVSSVEDLLLPEEPRELRRLMDLAYWKRPRVPNFIAQGVIDRYYRPNRAHHVALLNAVEANTRAHREAYAPPQQPTLIVWGEHDRVFPKRAAVRIHGELDGRSTLCVFDHAAHAPHLEREKDVTPLMKRFLRGNAVTCDPDVKL